MSAGYDHARRRWQMIPTEKGSRMSLGFQGLHHQRLAGQQVQDVAGPQKMVATAHAVVALRIVKSDPYRALRDT